jgi:hypothetical protein
MNGVRLLVHPASLLPPNLARQAKIVSLGSLLVAAVPYQKLASSMSACLASSRHALRAMAPQALVEPKLKERRLNCPKQARIVAAKRRSFKCVKGKSEASLDTFERA